MALKLDILEIVEAQDAEGNDTIHMWVQQPVSRKFKVNLGKASATELNTIMQNVGGVLLLDMGEMVQNGFHAMYFKSGGEIDILVPPSAKTTQPAQQTTEVKSAVPAGFVPKVPESAKDKAP